MRKQIDALRHSMNKMQMYSIDIARNPAKAIKAISDPLLELLNAKIEDFQEQL